VSSPAGEEAATAHVSPLRDRSVLSVLGMMALASIGAFAQATALGKEVYDISHRKLDLGLLGLAEFAPAALLVLATGHVADRFDRRKVAALAYLGEGACALALSLYAASTPTAVGPIFAIAFAFGVARAFAAPASRSLPANVPGRATLPKVMAVYSGTWQSALIIGPVVGGFLYAGGVSWPFYAAAALFVIASLAALSVRIRTDAISAPATRPATEGGGVRAALDGLRFIRSTPILLAAISLDLFAVLFGGAVGLLPAIADERLHVGAVGLGWLRAAGGIGAVLIAAVLAVKPVTTRIGRVLLISVAVFGVATIALGVTRSYVIAFAAIAVLSAADMVSVYIRGTLVPLVTPDQVRGRVLAAENVFIGASNELGAFESGVTGQFLGTVGAVVLGGVLTLAVAGLWWLRFPMLRDVNRFEDLYTEGAPAPVPDPAG
jgi:MFS family permease